MPAMLDPKRTVAELKELRQLCEEFKIRWPLADLHGEYQSSGFFGQPARMHRSPANTESK